MRPHCQAPSPHSPAARRSAMLCAPAPCAPTNAESWRKDRQVAFLVRREKISIHARSTRSLSPHPGPLPLGPQGGCSGCDPGTFQRCWGFSPSHQARSDDTVHGAEMAPSDKNYQTNTHMLFPLRGREGQGEGESKIRSLFRLHLYRLAPTPALSPQERENRRPSVSDLDCSGDAVHRAAMAPSDKNYQPKHAHAVPLSPGGISLSPM